MLAFVRLLPAKSVMTRPNSPGTDMPQDFDAAPVRARGLPYIVLGLLMSCALAGFLGWMVGLAWPTAPAPASTAPATRPMEAARAGIPPLAVPCLSYAPLRRPGHSPFDPSLQVSPEQIRDDLRQLATVTRCVRTYGVDQGAEAVPAIARELGLAVVLGAWISRDAARNAIELHRALTLAREHRDVVRLLVVGNEVLLRGEQTPQALAALLTQARAQSPVPVTYADVWEFWLRHAAVLADAVDVVTVHILPYWEDEPVGIEQAVGHVQSVAQRVRRHLGSKAVFIGETGWPAEGRQRGPARPGVAEQTRFVRELLAMQPQLPPFNLVEGFDQPWKRGLEGTVGGYWGLFDADAQARVHLSGALPRQAWQQLLPAVAAVAAVAALLAGVALRGGPASASGATPGNARGGRYPRRTHALAALLVAATVAAAAVWQGHLLATNARDPLEWMLHGGFALAGLPASALAWWLLSSPMPGRQAHTRDGFSNRRSTAACLSWLMLAAVLAVLLVQLAWDGRYRPLMWPLPIAGALALGTTWALHGTPAWPRCGVLVRLRQALLLLGTGAAAAVLWHEGPHNAQALWLACGWTALLISGWGVNLHARSDAGPARRPAGPA